MQHIRKLRSLYDSALGAKRAYHSLLAGQLQDQLHVDCMTHGLHTLHSTTMTMYYIAKHIVPVLYLDSATAVGLTWRYRQHINSLQTLYHARRCHTQCVMSHALDWTYRIQLASHAHRTMRALYDTMTRPIRQQLYLHYKRAREEWDPTATEATV